MLAPEVELNIPEVVDVEHDCPDPVLADLGLGNVEVDERLRIDGRPELLQGDPERKMSRCGREEVAAMEGAGNGVERVVRIRELMRLLDSTESVRRRHQEPVVGADEESPVPRAQGERAPVPTNTRVDHR